MENLSYKEPGNQHQLHKHLASEYLVTAKMDIACIVDGGRSVAGVAGENFVTIVATPHQ
jgi:hypothetical protein